MEIRFQPRGSEYIDMLNYKLETVLYTALKLSFPRIQNLKVENGEITFDDTIYSKKEVESKLEEIKNYKP